MKEHVCVHCKGLSLFFYIFSRTGFTDVTLLRIDLDLPLSHLIYCHTLLLSKTRAKHSLVGRLLRRLSNETLRVSCTKYKCSVSYTSYILGIKSPEINHMYVLSQDREGLSISHDLVRYESKNILRSHPTPTPRILTSFKLLAIFAFRTYTTGESTPTSEKTPPTRKHRVQMSPEHRRHEDQSGRASYEITPTREHTHPVINQFENQNFVTGVCFLPSHTVRERLRSRRSASTLCPQTKVLL